LDWLAQNKLACLLHINAELVIIVLTYLLNGEIE
jgi:hypothetical protein